ncbi:chromosome partition protein Smc [Clostridia bacterium]|nr:chromosome partition protein Smc [Clostridia bacterium]
MYLKTIEVHGFKSFANKIIFEFHNGITAIVGPNGSGKSNVGDAVRWVLGEQSAKQLRGANMQDVIFSGTVNRKPLSYAYVAITLDNADRHLGLDFNEVTIARRVYRSGESEYLMNGTSCRLKDVQELFYDTGIGKEGYSIIGQGQIEKILNGKPDERRELFDEAAGIVKYKRRKAAAQKKLENERQNLIRVNDILSELEKQVEPLEQQSEKARAYLKKKEDLKSCDVDLFVAEVGRVEREQADTEEKITLTTEELRISKEKYEATKEKYEATEREMEQMESAVSLLREELSDTGLKKGKLEGEIDLLEEQIKSVVQSREHYGSRKEAVLSEIEEKSRQQKEYEEEEAKIAEKLHTTEAAGNKAREQHESLSTQIAEEQSKMEAGKQEAIDLLHHKSDVKVNRQHYDTMREQANIRQAQINKLLLEKKSEEAEFVANQEEAQKELSNIREKQSHLAAEEDKIETKRRQWQEQQTELDRKIEETTKNFHRSKARLDSMTNIAERYDGYGNSIRRAMEQKATEPGICGVVADFIKTKPEYETAIETALGGSVQNIVTKDEETAKRVISHLKKNRYGRATFLPLTSVGKHLPPPNEAPLAEEGVLGIASRLVSVDKEYGNLATYLLGRTYVVDHIDHATALARKFRYSLRIVTLEGESLNPGGSMTGGAFKNSSHLLGRKREIEELEKEVASLHDNLQSDRERLEGIKTARELLKDDLNQIREDLQQAGLEENSAIHKTETLGEQIKNAADKAKDLLAESNEIEQQILQLKEENSKILEDIEAAGIKEAGLEEENKRLEEKIDKDKLTLEELFAQLSALQLEESTLSQQDGFAKENINRTKGEVGKLTEELDLLTADFEHSDEQIDQKKDEIKKLTEEIKAHKEAYAGFEEHLANHQRQKEEMTARYKGFFGEREAIAEENSRLDKELFRLNNQLERLIESLTNRNAYMWEEYELTYHNALPLAGDEEISSDVLKAKISELKEEIRSLGNVNVNAIEEYKEVSERYFFLKTQHDDLITAENTLLGIIEELDEGMRKQFLEKFTDIQREFDAAFRELFGGGKGSLELLSDEDILESGIRIIAQPPGKKLQNMMQLSGGEKSLTAIALLFAIQNLKPSPFCLLDEIEAALDDSNVGRFAKYLHRLTKNTQFIVITHRRGTMAAADRLYGITMQEKGVSTLVSVNLIEHDLTE